MDPGVVIALFPAAFGGALVTVLALTDRFSRRGRLLRVARSTPRTSVAQVAEGAIVMVIGIVRLRADALTAPLSGKRCGAYDAELSRHVATDRERIWHERRMVGFHLEDGSARALIDPWPGLELSVAKRDLDTSADRDAIRAILEGEGKGISSDRVEALEWSLTEGAKVMIYGKARWMADPDPDERSLRGYRDAPRLLAITPLAILDRY